MTLVKTALLSFLMISAIVLTGVGIYAADATAGNPATDGYGISAVVR
ncbi:MAG: hypothetical protein M9905_09735 [Rhizobiaceae bacterium]|nr:hypothetical protein [Rhizobiaceae bacterium]